MLKTLSEGLVTAIVGLFLFMSMAGADPGLPYELLAGQMQVEQADHDRVPQMELKTEPMYGAMLLKETDYRGEGQFPLEFARFSISPINSKIGCGRQDAMNGGWTHSYSGCLINKLNASGASSNRTISVCTMGVCTKFMENLKPYARNIHDTLVKNGTVNGVTYPWVYTHFKTGIREAYNGNNRLVARFDRSGIEHRITYVVGSEDQIDYVTHMPSGRRLIFQYTTRLDLYTNSDRYILASVTDPASQVYKYTTTPQTIVPGSSVIAMLPKTTEGKLELPAADAGGQPLVRTYTSKLLIKCDSSQAYYYLNSVTESGQTLLNTSFEWPCGTSVPTYSRITRAGHNAKNLIQKRAYVANSNPAKYQMTDQFADSDTGVYRSNAYDRSFKCINCTDTDTAFLYRPVAVSARCAGCDADYQGYTWQKNGDLLTRTDYLNRVTSFTYNSNGLPLTETEAYGTPEARTTTRTWDSRFPLKTSEVVGEVAKDWRYNDQGHVTREMVRPASEALVNDACPANSKTCHQTDYSYYYDPNTHVTLRVVKTGPRPENGASVTDYRSNGDLWKTTDALDHVAEVVSVNAHGQITNQADVNGIHTITTYNALRQPKTVTVGNDVTRYDYYTDGRLKALTRPDNSVLNYTYTPAGSVKTVSLTHDGITDSVEYQRDSRGKVLHTVASRSGDNSQTWHQSFDDKGLLLTASDGSGGWNRELKHNANNLQERSCLSGEICELTFYTGLDQISDRARAPLLSNGTLGAQTPLFSLDYDVAGRVKQVVDPVNATSILTNNELGKHTDEDSPDFGNRGSDYDLAGNETYRADSDGNSAVKQYDALDRLTRIDYSDGGSLVQTWDTPPIGDESNAANYRGRLSGRVRTHSPAQDNATVAESFRYNARGDVVGIEQKVKNYAPMKVSANYGPSGRLESLTYPSGLTVLYRYGADGHVQNIRTLYVDGRMDTLARDITYQPLIGRLRSLVFGNGVSYSRIRDAGGRLSAIRVMLPDQTVAYHHDVRYDDHNRVTGYGEFTFGYDDLDHLASQSTSQSRQLTAMNHDNNGNLLTLENYNAVGVKVRGDNLAYAENRLASETINPAPADGTGGVSASYGYDLSGFVTANGNRSYGYAASREMISVTLNGNRESYLYDGDRRRVLKYGQSTAQYLYDTSGHLLTETLPGNIFRNYVWLGDIPLAAVDHYSNGSIIAYYIETDFTNTPRFLRRWNGDVSKPLWSWPIAPYGDTPALEDPDGDGEKLTFNLRYPGQYYDAFSGLHYNHTRYFSPRTGRYLQPDLIGLEGGTNVYTYANGNSVSYTDPTGTFALLGAFAGATFDLGLQMYSNGGDIGAVNWGDVGISAVLGATGGGLLGKIGKITDTIRDASKVAKGLPDKADDLLRQGYKDVSHPDAAKAGHKTFENPISGDKVRFDQGKSGQPGYEGLDHYHRYNPNATGKQDMYLDKNGNPCARGCDASHLFPGD